MTIPNFLVVGAAKSGTTSLHHYLHQHPQIYMSPQKETFFFNFDGQMPDYTGPGDMDFYQGRTILDFNTYQAQFDGVKEEKAIGEACPQYLSDSEAPRRIHHYLPDIKLIAVLRNPIERAYSSFMHMRRDGYESVADFSEALRLEQSRMQANWRPIWHYKSRGFYSKQLQTYWRYFDASRLRIYLHEDLKQNPEWMLQDIFRFLEVDEHFSPDTSMKHNVAGIPRSKSLLKLVMTPNTIKAWTRPLLPRPVRDFLKRSLTASSVNLIKPQLPADARTELLIAYREEILALQEMIGRDLSHWLSP